jgi:hypothetical protein
VFFLRLDSSDMALKAALKATAKYKWFMQKVDRTKWLWIFLLLKRFCCGCKKGEATADDIKLLLDSYIAEMDALGDPSSVEKLFLQRCGSQEFLCCLEKSLVPKIISSFRGDRVPTVEIAHQFELNPIFVQRLAQWGQNKKWRTHGHNGSIQTISSLQDTFSSSIRIDPKTATEERRGTAQGALCIGARGLPTLLRR